MHNDLPSYGQATQSPTGNATSVEMTSGSSWVQRPGGPNYSSGRSASTGYTSAYAPASTPATSAGRPYSASPAASSPGNPPVSSPDKGSSGGHGGGGGFEFCVWSDPTGSNTADEFVKIVYLWNTMYMVLAWIMLFDHGWSTMSSCGPGFEEKGFRFGLFSYHGPNQESSPENYSDCHKYQTFGCDDIKSGTLGVLVVMIIAVLCVTLWWIGITLQSCFHCGLIGFRTTLWLYIMTIIISLCAPVIWLASAQPEINELRSFASCHILFVGWPVFVNFGLLVLKVFVLPGYVTMSSDAYIFEASNSGTLYW